MRPLLLLALALPLPLLAQATPRDSAVVDSLAAQRLGGVRVEVTRTPDAGAGPWAVGLVGAQALRRAQATLGLDEALAQVPGVIVANRYNYATDSRLSIRGAGSRANFGIRGVKVLLDGVPQSLPDGQSQLTNVDLAAIGRAEVLRGSSSTLYGNGSGGVLAFTTDLSAPHPLGASLRATAGSFGLAKTQARVAGRQGATLGAVSASRTTLDGFRQYSSADTRQLLGAVDHLLADRHRLSLRAGTAETPHALNPGALSFAEYAANPDSATANNTRRGASRAISQRYASVGIRREGRHTYGVTLYGQRRFVDNPLAVAPPGASPTGPNGTLNLIDRRVTGARLDATTRFRGSWSPRLSMGIDWQRSHDGRRNYRTTGGVRTAPTDTLLLDQSETVTSLGRFLLGQVDPHRAVTVSAGLRQDALTFRVADRFLGDGDDDSARRTMSAWSGHAGVLWRAAAWAEPYANLSTAFETPTTTELAARSDGAGGFNPDLDPQRVRSVEVGVRGAWAGRAAGARAAAARVTYEVAYFDAVTADAIVQYLETAGRAYFRNAGRTRGRGVEVGLTAAPADWVAFRAAFTHSALRFTEYRIRSLSVVDTLDGNRLAGVPKNHLRTGARFAWAGFALDADHTAQSALFADDRNTLVVRGWGQGRLDLRGSWRGGFAGWTVEPFAALNNALDERYVGAVTINGFGGRVLEPAPRRHWFAGLEVSAPILR